jgi:hypothetical protein
MDESDLYQSRFILSGTLLALSIKTKHMRAYLFILVVFPVIAFAQNQQVPPANGATDCPTFGKKNTSSKAGLFQYLKANKSPKTEQQTVYRTSALPTLKPTPEEQEAIELKKQQRAERAAGRRQKQSKNDPVREEEPVVATAAGKKVKTQEGEDGKAVTEKPAQGRPMTDKPALAEGSDDKPAVEKVANIDEESSAKEDADKRAEERDKKMRKAATKGKLQHIFKRTNKPTSRKNVQKCPQF